MRHFFQQIELSKDRLGAVEKQIKTVQMELLQVNSFVKFP